MKSAACRIGVSKAKIARDLKGRLKHEVATTV